MTKSLRDYIAETQTTQDRPVTGDQFAINIREECLLETAIADITEDGIVLEADDRFMEILESYGMLAEDSRDAVRSAISRRIMSHDMDLLSRHGIDRVMAAIDDAADRYGSSDLDEIGTSDVSAFVNSVRQSLEGSDSTLKEATSEAVRNAMIYMVMTQKKDLLDRFGAQRVVQAIDAALAKTAPDQFRTLKSRDLPDLVSNLEQQLTQSGQLAELSPGRVERYAHAAQRDMARHSAAAKTLRHQRGAEDWQAQEHEREADRRERGLARAQRKMTEGAVKDIAIQYQDWKQMSPKEFFSAYKMTKDAWMAQNRDIVKTTEAYELDEMRRRAGVAEGDITQLEKDIADAPVRPIASMEASCGSMREVLDRLDRRHQQDEEGGIGPGDLREGDDDESRLIAIEMGYRAAALYSKGKNSNPFEYDDPRHDEWLDGWREGAAEAGLDESDDAAAARASRARIEKPAVFRKQERFLPSQDRGWQASLQDLEQAQDLHRRERAQREKDLGLDEAEYQGRKVALGKPMQGDVKKFKVYVKDPKTGNVKKVNFGDPNMRIKKSNPARRKSFRARHNCANPGPRTKARYWSCRAW